jgi:hypothetical protein
MNLNDVCSMLQHRYADQFAQRWSAWSRRFAKLQQAPTEAAASNIQHKCERFGASKIKAAVLLKALFSLDLRQKQHA